MSTPAQDTLSQVRWNLAHALDAVTDILMDDKPLAGLLEDRLELSHRLRQVEHELEAQAADVAYLLDITKLSAPSLIREMAAVARSVLDAPRLWLCEVYWEVSAFGPRTACVASPTQHSKCRWVRLVDDPQGSEQ